MHIEKTVEREILNSPVTAINIPKRREVTLQPDSITVVISGAESVVNEMSPDKIEVTVNCAKVKIKEPVRIPVQVKLPATVNLKKAEPDSVEVFTK